MLDDLLLISGADIPFPAARLAIHQPIIKEIAYIGEENFFIGCELLRFSKNRLSDEDKINLENQTDFDIIMSIMQDKTNMGTQRSASCALLVLVLLFPEYKIFLRQNAIALLWEDEKGQTEEFIINNENYDEFKKIVTAMFCMQEQQAEEEYKPQGRLAKKIAEKLKRGKEKVAQQKGKVDKISIFGRYSSILSIGMNIPITEFLNYTVYQLFDTFTRYELKANYDIFIQAKMAGAKDLKEVDNWMMDIHEKDKY